MTPSVATVERRSPETVMRLERMGSFHQCRLSFMRTLLRRMKREAWSFDRPRFDVDDDGVGTALYTATVPVSNGADRTYTLVAFAHDLAPEMRSDRVIATAWDATFTLHDGVPSSSDIERLRENVPLQEAGRVSASELTLSRANRSVRLFSSVVDSLAAGEQPDVDLVDGVGYLMRTTAVYGSGKFGAADRALVSERPELLAPFQAEMLTVFLIRAFVMDLVEHMAFVKAPETAVVLEPAIRRRFGVGNSTGLGMAPFLITHPRLINNWIAAREEALVRVRSVEHATDAEIAHVLDVTGRARLTVDSWHSDHEAQQRKLAHLHTDLDSIDAYLASADLRAAHAWNAMVVWAHETLSVEGQELVVSLLLEPYGHLVDELANTMHANESSPARIDGSLSIDAVRSALESTYGWALAIDWERASADARAWYVSEEKLEPRLGERHDEPIGEYEQPLQPGRDASRMYADLAGFDDSQTLAEFLRAHPEHRYSARRLMVVADSPYGEIRDNTIDAEMLPIDLLRSKLSFFGATHFDPRSDRWVRITMFRGAPFPNEVLELDPDAWTYPAAYVAGSPVVDPPVE